MKVEVALTAFVTKVHRQVETEAQALVQPRRLGMESSNAESACVHGQPRRCAKDEIRTFEESWMQQDLGGTSAEELEGVRLCSQRGANMR
jgi:hypothetical protein